MARIRTIKPEFPQSQSVGQLSRDARLCFILLWTIADDEGRMRGHARMLASLLFPYDDDAPLAIEGWLGELDATRHIRRYSVDGAQYIEIVNWTKHQKIDRPTASRLPPSAVARALASPREASPTDRDRDPDLDRGISVAGATDADASVPCMLSTRVERAGASVQALAPDWPDVNITDLKRLLFGQCLLWLAHATGRPADRLRATVGRWCKDHGDGAVLEGFIAARRASPVDPIAWIAAALKPRGKHGRVDDTEHRRRALAGAFADCFGEGAAPGGADRAPGAGGEAGAHAGAVAGA